MRKFKKIKKTFFVLFRIMNWLKKLSFKLMQHHLFISFDFIVIETILKNQSNNCIKQYCTHFFLSYDPIRTVATKIWKRWSIFRKRNNASCVLSSTFFVLSILGCFLVSMGVYAWLISTNSFHVISCAILNYGIYLFPSKKYSDGK